MSLIFDDKFSSDFILEASTNYISTAPGVVGRIDNGDFMSVCSYFIPVVVFLYYRVSAFKKTSNENRMSYSCTNVFKQRENERYACRVTDQDCLGIE